VDFKKRPPNEGRQQERSLKGSKSVAEEEKGSAWRIFNIKAKQAEWVSVVLQNPRDVQRDKLKERGKA
jgi:hypothetical protein